MRKRKIFHLRIAVLFGFLAAGYYFSWWLDDDRLRSPMLLLILLTAFIYWAMQMASNWVLYLFAHRSETKPVADIPDIAVDVFITSYHEPFELVERALAAACSMRGKHKTWLLDDGNDITLAELAEKLGAGYLTRESNRDAKAGNINTALARTNGEVIAIFDVDHVPNADFLERSLGYFTNPEVGFVQVMLTFQNGPESWVAQAAVETSLEFYNPTSLGADALGGVTLMGSNALIRRSALESIGGYRPGLAEDLATSISLHAAGWKSVYVREPLAPGLAPPSFIAWFTQQLKWARGVFELLLTLYPKLFPRLTIGQRISYAVRMTKYWIGPVIAVHLFATVAILMYARPEVRQAFHEYLIRISPLALADAVIRHIAFRMYRHKQVRKVSLARAVSLVYGTWPVYTLAWLMAVLRVPLSFQPTPKDSRGRLHPIWLFPQLIALLLISGGALYTVIVGEHPVSLLLTFAVLQALIQMVFFTQWLYAQPRFHMGRRYTPGDKPVAVLDIDFHKLPESIQGLDAYQQAFCLLRVNGTPAGQALVPVLNGSITRESLRRGILSHVGWEFWHSWLEGSLEWQPLESQFDWPSITLAVCTRDRPDDLRRCLRSFEGLPDLGQDVLVVDSCSQSEMVRRVVEEFPHVQYVREALPGLDRARNRASREAKGEILAFIDDDAVIDPAWLERLLLNFQNPRVACVTGLTMPLELETKAQQWFEWFSSFGRGFRRVVFDKNTLHPLSAGHAGAGVNMAFRKQVLDILGPFDETLDAGTPTRSGGDTEMFSRVLAAGYCIAYDPAVLCWHRHRKDWEGLRGTIFGYGVGTYAFWTRRLVREHQWEVVPAALDWALKYQAPALLSSLMRLPHRMPADLLITEMAGCLAGPWSYFASRLAEARNGHGQPS